MDESMNEQMNEYSVKYINKKRLIWNQSRPASLHRDIRGQGRQGRLGQGEGKWH